MVWLVGILGHLSFLSAVFASTNCTLSSGDGGVNNNTSVVRLLSSLGLGKYINEPLAVLELEIWKGLSSAFFGSLECGGATVYSGLTYVREEGGQPPRGGCWERYQVHLPYTGDCAGLVQYQDPAVVLLAGTLVVDGLDGAGARLQSSVDFSLELPAAGGDLEASATLESHHACTRDEHCHGFTCIIVAEEGRGNFCECETSRPWGSLPDNVCTGQKHKGVQCEMDVLPPWTQGCPAQALTISLAGSAPGAGWEGATLGKAGGAPALFTGPVWFDCGPPRAAGATPPSTRSGVRALWRRVTPPGGAEGEKTLVALAADPPRGGVTDDSLAEYVFGRVGEWRVWYEGEDWAGNVATCAFSVLVSDGSPPLPLAVPGSARVCGQTLRARGYSKPPRLGAALQLLYEQGVGAAAGAGGWADRVVRGWDSGGFVQQLAPEGLRELSGQLCEASRDNVDDGQTHCRAYSYDAYFGPLTLRTQDGQEYLPEGEYLVAADIFDRFGNRAWCNFTVVIDNTPPLLRCAENARGRSSQHPTALSVAGQAGLPRVELYRVLLPPSSSPLTAEELEFVAADAAAGGGEFLQALYRHQPGRRACNNGTSTAGWLWGNSADNATGTCVTLNVSAGVWYELRPDQALQANAGAEPLSNSGELRVSVSGPPGCQGEDELTVSCRPTNIAGGSAPSSVATATFCVRPRGPDDGGDDAQARWRYRVEVMGCAQDYGVHTTELPARVGRELAEQEAQRLQLRALWFGPGSAAAVTGWSLRVSYAAFDAVGNAALCVVDYEVQAPVPPRVQLAGGRTARNLTLAVGGWQAPRPALVVRPTDWLAYDHAGSGLHAHEALELLEWWWTSSSSIVACPAPGLCEQHGMGSAGWLQAYPGSGTLRFRTLLPGAAHPVQELSMTLALWDPEPPLFLDCGPGAAYAPVRVEIALGQATYWLDSVSDAQGPGRVVDRHLPAVLPRVMASYGSGLKLGHGAWNITYTAEDWFGNRATCTRQWLVSDVQAPALICLPPQGLAAFRPRPLAAGAGPGGAGGLLYRVAMEPGTCGPPPDAGTGPSQAWVDYRSSDAQGGVRVETTCTTGGSVHCFVNATDTAGLQASCSLAYEWVDLEPPQMNCPATGSLPVGLAPQCIRAQLLQGLFQGSDNCKYTGARFWPSAEEISSFGFADSPFELYVLGEDDSPDSPPPPPCRISVNLTGFCGDGFLDLSARYGAAEQCEQNPHPTSPGCNESCLCKQGFFPDPRGGGGCLQVCQEDAAGCELETSELAGTRCWQGAVTTWWPGASSSVTPASWLIRALKPDFTAVPGPAFTQYYLLPDGPGWRHRGYYRQQELAGRRTTPYADFNATQVQTALLGPGEDLVFEWLESGPGLGPELELLAAPRDWPADKALRLQVCNCEFLSAGAALAAFVLQADNSTLINIDEYCAAGAASTSYDPASGCYVFEICRSGLVVIGAPRSLGAAGAVTQACRVPGTAPLLVVNNSATNCSYATADWLWQDVLRPDVWKYTTLAKPRGSLLSGGAPSALYLKYDEQPGARQRAHLAAGHSTTLSWRATNGSGLSCDWGVEVRDVLPPRFVCNDGGGWRVLSDPGTGFAFLVGLESRALEDETDATRWLLPQRLPGGDNDRRFYVGNTTLLWTGSDSSGNPAEPCLVQVRVVDEEPPSLTCPDTVVRAPPGHPGWSGVLTSGFFFTDNLPAQAVSYFSVPVPAPLDLTGPQSFHVLTHSVQDAGGNIGYCQFRVWVLGEELTPAHSHCNDTTMAPPAPLVPWAPPSTLACPAGTSPVLLSSLPKTHFYDPSAGTRGGSVWGVSVGEQARLWALPPHPCQALTWRDCRVGGSGNATSWWGGCPACADCPPWLSLSLQPLLADPDGGVPFSLPSNGRRTFRGGWRATATCNETGVATGSPGAWVELKLPNCSLRLLDDLPPVAYSWAAGERPQLTDATSGPSRREAAAPVPAPLPGALLPLLAQLLPFWVDSVGLEHITFLNANQSTRQVTAQEQLLTYDIIFSTNHSVFESGQTAAGVVGALARERAAELWLADQPPGWSAPAPLEQLDYLTSLYTHHLRMLALFLHLVPKLGTNSFELQAYDESGNSQLFTLALLLFDRTPPSFVNCPSGTLALRARGCAGGGGCVLENLTLAFGDNYYLAPSYGGGLSQRNGTALVSWGRVAAGSSVSHTTVVSDEAGNNASCTVRALVLDDDVTRNDSAAGAPCPPATLVVRAPYPGPLPTTGLPWGCLAGLGQARVTVTDLATNAPPVPSSGPAAAFLPGQYRVYARGGHVNTTKGQTPALSCEFGISVLAPFPAPSLQLLSLRATLTHNGSFLRASFSYTTLTGYPYVATVLPSWSPPPDHLLTSSTAMHYTLSLGRLASDCKVTKLNLSIPYEVQCYGLNETVSNIEGGCSVAALQEARLRLSAWRLCELRTYRNRVKVTVLPVNETYALQFLAVSSLRRGVRADPGARLETGAPPDLQAGVTARLCYLCYVLPNSSSRPAPERVALSAAHGDPVLTVNGSARSLELLGGVHNILAFCANLSANDTLPEGWGSLNISLTLYLALSYNHTTKLANSGDTDSGDEGLVTEAALLPGLWHHQSWLHTVLSAKAADGAGVAQSAVGAQRKATAAAIAGLVGGVVAAVAGLAVLLLLAYLFLQRRRRDSPDQTAQDVPPPCAHEIMFPPLYQRFPVLEATNFSGHHQLSHKEEKEKEEEQGGAGRGKDTPLDPLHALTPVDPLDPLDTSAGFINFRISFDGVQPGAPADLGEDAWLEGEVGENGSGGGEGGEREGGERESREREGEALGRHSEHDQSASVLVPASTQEGQSRSSLKDFDTPRETDAFETIETCDSDSALTHNAVDEEPGSI